MSSYQTVRVPYLLMIEVPGTVGFIQPVMELAHGEYLSRKLRVPR
jgi:hypothetical protein